jgi:hypothetical protein
MNCRWISSSAPMIHSSFSRAGFLFIKPYNEWICNSESAELEEELVKLRFEFCDRLMWYNCIRRKSFTFSIFKSIILN